MILKYKTLYSKSKMSLNREKLLTNDVDMSTILFVMAKLLLGEVTAYIFLKTCLAIQCLSCYSFRSHVKPWAYLINSFKFRQGKYQIRKPVKKSDYVVDWQNISLKMFVGCLLNKAFFASVKIYSITYHLHWNYMKRIIRIFGQLYTRGKSHFLNGT